MTEFKFQFQKLNKTSDQSFSINVHPRTQNAGAISELRFDRTVGSNDYQWLIADNSTDELVMLKADDVVTDTNKLILNNIWTTQGLRRYSIAFYKNTVMNEITQILKNDLGAASSLQSQVKIRLRV